MRVDLFRVPQQAAALSSRYWNQQAYCTHTQTNYTTHYTTRDSRDERKRETGGSKSRKSRLSGDCGHTIRLL